jgi:hypothetical protein
MTFRPILEGMSFFLTWPRVARRGALVIGLAALTGLAGCGDDVPPPPRTDLPYELYCDIGNSECQERIYDSLAAMLGAEGLARPTIRTISVEQHTREVRNGLDLGDLTGEDPKTRGLRLLGFIPEASESVTETQAEYWITQIAAYYNRGNHAITVIDRDYEEINAQTLLAHELTHAIQHSQFDLNQVSVGADTEDAVMGARGVIEGDAMHSSFAWTYERLGYVHDEIDWEAIHEEREAAARNQAGDPEVALIDSASSFPYSYGFDFMTSASLDAGLAGRAAQFASPPTTAMEVMAGYGALLLPFDFPEVAHPSPVEEHSVQVENRFGAWYVYGFLRRRGVSDYPAWLTASSWLGDELGIYENGSEVVAVWRVRFEHPWVATILRDEVSSDTRDVAWSAVLYEGDVFVFSAESNETLLAWAEQPLDSISASLIPKGERRGGGAVSVADCMQPRDFSLPNPPPLLH